MTLPRDPIEEYILRILNALLRQGKLRRPPRAPTHIDATQEVICLCNDQAVSWRAEGSRSGTVVEMHAISQEELGVDDEALGTIGRMVSRNGRGLMVVGQCARCQRIYYELPIRRKSDKIQE